MPTRSRTARRFSWKVATSLIVAVLVLVPAALAVHAVVGAASAKHHKHRRAFAIKNNVRRPFAPGVMRRLNLRLTNHRNHTLWITRLRVRVKVDRAHRLAGCKRARNFRVRQMGRRAYPLKLRAHKSRRLRRLGVRVKRLPRMRMRFLRYVNQDACKGARLRLVYRGRARSTPPPRRRPRPAAPTRRGPVR
jgi:hypothetical protein